jgi:hypothetical protein
MRKLAFTFCILLLTLSYGPDAFAQETVPAPPTPQAADVPVHFFHLLFVVQELGPDGKPTNSRSYSATVSTAPRESGTSIRTSSRIPVATGSFASGGTNTNIQYQYIDVGVDIDTHNTREIGRKLSIDITAHASSVAKLDENLHQPIVRENKWQGTVLIPLDKPTVVFTSDSLDNKGSMQMVVTATSLQ